MTAANIIPTAFSDGIVYANSVPLTSSEATLGDALQVPASIPTVAGEAIVATVSLTVDGIITASNAYVVMQMDMGDGNWVDMNWLVWTGRQGSALFVFSNGVAGANSFQQSRPSGAFPTPQAVGSNQLTLGGRIRFVGKAITAGGSSSTVGAMNQVSATISYRILTLR